MVIRGEGKGVEGWRYRFIHAPPGQALRPFEEA